MISRPIRPAALLVALTITAACARDGGGGDMRRDSASVDATASRTGANAPRFGEFPDYVSEESASVARTDSAWAATRRFSFRGVAIDLPAALNEMSGGDTDRVVFVDLPGCPAACEISVSVDRDPALAKLEDVEADLREQPAEPDDPPVTLERITLGAEPALRREARCDDCASRDYALARGGRVVWVTVALDGAPAEARPALFARAERALATFRWDTAAPPAYHAP